MDAQGSHDLMEVERKKKSQEKLPPELRYDVAPKIEGIMDPVYPYPLLREGTKGKAKVAILIDEKGEVQEVRVLEATDSAFGDALIAAVCTYRFTPALKDGRETSSILAREQIFEPNGYEDFPSAQDLTMLRLETRKPEAIVGPSKLDSPLKPISQRTATYPLNIALGEGKATVEVLIDEDGFVRLPRVVEASETAFGYSAVQAAAAWRFEPAKVGGKPVVVRARVPFIFKRNAKLQGAIEPEKAGAVSDAKETTTPEAKPNTDVGEKN
jgi:TonB family protein